MSIPKSINDTATAQSSLSNGETTEVTHYDAVEINLPTASGVFEQELFEGFDSDTIDLASVQLAKQAAESQKKQSTFFIC